MAPAYSHFLTYEQITERFTLHECTLLTSKEDFISKRDELKVGSKNVPLLVKTSCGHEVTATIVDFGRVPGKWKCHDCAWLNYETIFKRFKDKGCTMLYTKDEYEKIRKDEQLSHTRVPIKFMASCGHERIEILEKLKIKPKWDWKCMDCKQHTSYETMYERFVSKECILLTTKDDYYNQFKVLKSTDIIPLSFTASCGHLRESSHTIMRESDNWLCTDCVNANTKKFQIDNAVVNDALECEYKAYLYLKDLVIDKFDVKKLGDGTKADFIAKPKNQLNDQWIQIQIKSTKQKTNSTSYMFNSGKKDYSGMIFACVCVQDKKIWIVPTELSKLVANITISEKADTKYDKYKCDDLSSFLESAYNHDKYIKIDAHSARIPVSVTFKISFDFIILREEKLPFLNFEYPEIDNQVYDFKINNHKVQEKCTTFSRRNMVAFKIFKTQKSIPYAKGDNDFYWLSCPDKKTFFVIPEYEMILNGYITTEDQPGTIGIEISFQSVYKSDFVHLYKFDYDNPNISKLQELLK